MALLITCDQCDRFICQDHQNAACECGKTTHLDLLIHDEHPDRPDGDILKFRGWPCLATYATARALVESAEDPP